MYGKYNSIILFTKNYPPQIGGIEKYSYDLYNLLKKENRCLKIIKAYPRNLFLFQKSSSNFLYKYIYIISELIRLAHFFLKSITVGLYYSFFSDLIWGLDGSLGLLVVLIGNISGTKTRLTLHGTDVVWGNKIYQFLMPYFWFKIDHFYCVSSTIFQEALKRGVCSSKILVKEHTLDSTSFTTVSNLNKISFLRSNNIPDDKIILFSIGRFIQIKGFHWFISEVLPFLNTSFHYVLGGFGPLLGEYMHIIKRKNLKNISIIGPLNEEEKAKWFFVSDYFVMPNIGSGGVEGFGIVLLEAHYHEKKSIISNIHGIAQRAGQYDIVLPSENSLEWIKNINKLTLGKR